MNVRFRDICVSPSFHINSWASRKICLTHSHKYFSTDIPLSPHDGHGWPGTKLIPGVPWNTRVLPWAPAQGWAWLNLNLSSAERHMWAWLWDPGHRGEVSGTQSWDLSVFLGSVCLSAAHVAPGNTKPPVSDYKYTINAISDLFFLLRLGKRIWRFLNKKSLTWRWCILIATANIDVFVMHKHRFDVTAKALRGFDSERWSLEKDPSDFGTPATNNFQFGRTGLRTTLMCCLLWGTLVLKATDKFCTQTFVFGGGAAKQACKNH